jgi:2-polyprenyl-3-methyl-5-hydroxy-6-metoxy-1,4-benzoquinol methylase
VLGKYDVKYFKCDACDFIQTEEPYWLGEAYGNAITQLDLGLVYRNEYLSSVVTTIINSFFNTGTQFLDYGGGYGLFVRMMRDRGFEFYRQDIYCENLFAKYFDITDLPPSSKFDMLTAFEVFEHLPEPIAEMKKMLSYSDTILFTTELQPAEPNALKNWWYFTPETGQHVSLYSRKSLNKLAEKFNLHLLSHNNLHLLSKTKRSSLLYNMTFLRIFQKVTSFMKKRKSLLSTDFEVIKSKIDKLQIL